MRRRRGVACPPCLLSAAVYTLALPKGAGVGLRELGDFVAVSAVAASGRQSVDTGRMEYLRLSTLRDFMVSWPSMSSYLQQRSVGHWSMQFQHRTQ